MAERDDLTTGTSGQPNRNLLDDDREQFMPVAGFGEEALDIDEDYVAGTNTANDMRPGGRNSSSQFAGNMDSMQERDAMNMQDNNTLNDVDAPRNNMGAASMGSTPSNSYDLDADTEMNARPQTGMSAASTRFGDEFTQEDNSILSGSTSRSGIENDSPTFSSRFGEELSARERNIYPTDTSFRSTDDLTDDNDALTDSSSTRRHSDTDERGEDKNLWEKLKDKAEDIGEGIKKAFD